MRPGREVYDALAGLLCYPGADFHELLLAARGALAAGFPRALTPFDDFVAYAASLPADTLEEDFVRTFEHSEERALEVGWHVFGESYTRGTFLVTMRGLLRELGVDERGELPDHLAHAVAVLGRIEPTRGERFVKHSFGPAARRIHEALLGCASPWAALFATVLELFGVHARPDGWDVIRPVATVEEP